MVGGAIGMTNIKCVEVVVKEKPAPPEEKPPEEMPPVRPPTERPPVEKPPEGKIPWEYIALGAGIALPVVGILAFSRIVGEGHS